MNDCFKTTTQPEAMNKEDCSGSKGTLWSSHKALVLSRHLFDVSWPFVKLHDEVRVMHTSLKIILLL